MKYYKYILYRYCSVKRDYFKITVKATVAMVEDTGIIINDYLKEKINTKMYEKGCKPVEQIEVVKQLIYIDLNKRNKERLISEDRYQIEG